MNFVERLRQQEEVKKTEAEKLAAKVATEREAAFQKRLQEDEFHKHRKEQAVKFREECKVYEVVSELGQFLESLGEDYLVEREEYDVIKCKMEHKGGGSAICPISLDKLPLKAKDPDSIFDAAIWEDSKFAKKFIAVESCPDGTIVFHGKGWGGTTEIELKKWRIGDKAKIFDKALEKAYCKPMDYMPQIFPYPMGLRLDLGL